MLDQFKDFDNTKSMVPVSNSTQLTYFPKKKKVDAKYTSFNSNKEIFDWDMNALQNIKIGQDLKNDNKFAKHHQNVLESKVFDKYDDSANYHSKKSINERHTKSAFNGSGDFLKWSGEVKGSD